MGWYPGKILRERKGLLSQLGTLREEYGDLIYRVESAIAEEQEAIDHYAELINKLKANGLTVEADIVTEIRNDEIDHRGKFVDIDTRLRLTLAREWVREKG